jgi:hypothetical protein
MRRYRGVVNLKWFRMYSEARNDAKLRSLSDSQFRIWFNLLCFAAEQTEERGSIIGYDEELLAVEVANGDVELLNETLDKLERLRIIETNENGDITFINFSKRQYDNPSDRPEEVRKRVQKHRQAKHITNVTTRNEDVTTCNEDVTTRNEEVTTCNEEVTTCNEEVTTCNDIDTDTDTESDTDIYKKKETEATPYREIADLYHDLCPSLPRIRVLTDKRKQQIRARWKKYRDLEIFKELFRRAEESDFLSGRNGKWTSCNFDWLMNENNMVKVLEGNYSNRDPTPSPARDYLTVEDIRRQRGQGGGNPGGRTIAGGT